MDHPLIGVGIGCIIAAIVGGGLKAFALELPLVNSIRRRTLLGLLGVIIIVLAIPVDESTASSGAPTESAFDFTAGAWTLANATDPEGHNWDNSKLEFTSQEAAGNGFRLAGKFSWQKDGEPSDEESFTGSYVSSTRQITLAADSGSYSAILDADHRTLSAGQWTSTTDQQVTVMGTWTATR